MKINFKKIEAQTSFEGAKQTFDVAETVGNEMMYLVTEESITSVFRYTPCVFSGPAISRVPEDGAYIFPTITSPPK